MSLVDYADSDDEGEDANRSDVAVCASPLNKDARPTASKRKRQDEADPESKRPNLLPALPSNFHDLYASNVRTSTSDDPELHGGRQRQVPHVIGNWPSFVYIEWLPSDRHLAILNRIIDKAANQFDVKSSLRSCLYSDLGIRQPLHISLSAPLTLTTDNKDDFDQVLSQAIKDQKVWSSSILPNSLQWVSNFSRTRYFLIMTLALVRNHPLEKLLPICNEVARRFSLPELYTEGCDSVGVQGDSAANTTGTSVPPPILNDKLHVSIAWSLHKPTNATVGQSIPGGELLDINIPISRVRIKIGNRVSIVPLEGATK